MHAEVDDKQPLNSKLLFSNFDNSSMGEKQVTVADIYNMDINTKLLVLSACNTGKGKIRNGEGTLSLARAFMYAGCKSIVMTLWSVEDESSSVLMESFYKNLNKGYTKAKALQLAKVEYLKNNPPSKTHPYFWAGFIPVGNQEPVAKSNKTDINWAFIFIVAGVGFGLTPIFTNRKIKRSIRRKLRSRMLIK
jgi:CHAT domain-containing protein